MLTIGSKSPLAYADSCMFESVADEEDGKRYKSLWLLAKDDGLSKTSLLSSVETTEDTGVKFSMRVEKKDGQTFINKAYHLVLFPHIYFDGEFKGLNDIKVTEYDTYYRVENDTHYNFRYNTYLALGPVLYPCNESIVSYYNNGYSFNLIPKFDISELEVTQTRESIKINDSSSKIIKDRIGISNEKECERIINEILNIKTFEHVKKFFTTYTKKAIFKDAIMKQFPEYKFHELFFRKFIIEGDRLSLKGIGEFVTYDQDLDKLERVSFSSLGRHYHYYNISYENVKRIVLVYNDNGSHRLLNYIRTLYNETGNYTYFIINKYNLKGNLQKLRFLKSFFHSYHRLSNVEKTAKEKSEKVQYFNDIISYTGFGDYKCHETIEEIKLKYKDRILIYYYDGNSKNLQSLSEAKIIKSLRNILNKSKLKLIAINTIKSYKIMEQLTDNKKIINIETVLDKKYFRSADNRSIFNSLLSWLLIATGELYPYGYHGRLQSFLEKNNFVTDNELRNLYHELDINKEMVFTEKIKIILSRKESFSIANEAIQFIVLLKGYPEKLLETNDRYGMYIFDKTYRPESLSLGLKYLYSSPKIRTLKSKFATEKQEIVNHFNGKIKTLFKTTKKTK